MQRELKLMSMTYRSWKWLDDATEEQIDDAANEGAVERLADEARSLYDSIPDPRRDYDDDSDGGPEFESDEEAAAYETSRAKGIKSKWGQLEAIEEMMAARGARFARDYEHHNEMESQIEYLENRGEY